MNQKIYIAVYATAIHLSVSCPRVMGEQLDWFRKHIEFAKEFHIPDNTYIELSVFKYAYGNPSDIDALIRAAGPEVSESLLNRKKKIEAGGYYEHFRLWYFNEKSWRVSQDSELNSFPQKKMDTGRFENNAWEMNSASLNIKYSNADPQVSSGSNPVLQKKYIQDRLFQLIFGLNSQTLLSLSDFNQSQDSLISASHPSAQVENIKIALDPFGDDVWTINQIIAKPSDSAATKNLFGVRVEFANYTENLKIKTVCATQMIIYNGDQPAERVSLLVLSDIPEEYDESITKIPIINTPDGIRGKTSYYSVRDNRSSTDRVYSSSQDNSKKILVEEKTIYTNKKQYFKHLGILVVLVSISVVLVVNLVAKSMRSRQ